MAHVIATRPNNNTRIMSNRSRRWKNANLSAMGPIAIPPTSNATVAPKPTQPARLDVYGGCGRIKSREPDHEL